MAVSPVRHVYILTTPLFLFTPRRSVQCGKGPSSIASKKRQGDSLFSSEPEHEASMLLTTAEASICNP